MQRVKQLDPGTVARGSLIRGADIIGHRLAVRADNAEYILLAGCGDLLGIGGDLDGRDHLTGS
ncbi:hypothetical protein D3C84_1312980 [compost metagenome]